VHSGQAQLAVQVSTFDPWSWHSTTFVLPGAQTLTSSGTHAVTSDVPQPEPSHFTCLCPGALHMLGTVQACRSVTLGVQAVVQLDAPHWHDESQVRVSVAPPHAQEPIDVVEPLRQWLGSVGVHVPCGCHVQWSAPQTTVWVPGTPQ
jgi:hypothetical protein